MKPIQRLHATLFALFLLLLAACQHTAERPTSPPPLILVSIDGFRADYFNLGLTPTLEAIAREGVRARVMRPSFPSLTFPNHYSLVTGLRPDHHGIVHNNMRDADIPNVNFSMSNRDAVRDAQWWNDGEPIWNTASRHGLIAATMFWPGSEAPIHERKPDFWKPYDKAVTSDARVDQVMQWLDLPRGERPGFITLYFDVVDTQGHYTGPDSDELRNTLVGIESTLARLVNGLRERGLYDGVNLVIVSDHGMANVPEGHVVAIDESVSGDLFDLVSIGPVAGLEPRPGRADAMDEAFTDNPVPHAQCWRRDRLPERFHYGTHRRVPRWVCLADEGWALASRVIITQLPSMEPHLGAHGFDPELPSMAALFVARGPDFRTGVVVDGFDNVDVYPLLARLLRIPPEKNDGNPATTLPLMQANGSNP